MRETYHEDFQAEVFNSDVAHKVSAVIEQYRPNLGWKAGKISYEVGQQMTKLNIPLSKYDQPLEESAETFTVENDRVDEKIGILAQEGYTDFQTVPSGKNTVIVTTRPYTKKYGSR